ncbi:MAG: hypothetical protein J7641_05695 [Cyanobacteria bacterium SID2]|nr:hypothetical protein [Cyanobacteria bacterium SID2]
MSFPLSLNTLSQYATQRSIERGLDYYERGYVGSIGRREPLIEAEVSGEVQPFYHTCLMLDENDRVVSASCTCPYDGGGGANISLPWRWSICATQMSLRNARL